MGCRAPTYPPTLLSAPPQCFERGWFANRRCLDVGCNEGVVTLAITTKFGCKSMMGVDIDAQLIAKACMWVWVGPGSQGGRRSGVRLLVWVGGRGCLQRLRQPLLLPLCVRMSGEALAAGAPGVVSPAQDTIHSG